MTQQIKRIGGSTGNTTSKPVPAKRPIMPAKPASPGTLALPTSKQAIDLDLGHYVFLLYGREKIGKTTTAASWPNAIFFETEPGLKGQEVFSFNGQDGGVKNWAIFRQGVDLMIAGGHQFETVIIDTADRAYDLCLDWVCSERGIEYPGEDANDFGKSWRAVRSEFLEQIHRLLQAGIGVVFTSHAKEAEVKGRSGDKFTRIVPSMSGQARQVIEALVDFFFYAEYFSDAQGNTIRVFVCQGDETIWAGARKDFPRFVPMVKDGAFELIKRAFLGQYQGLDASQLRVSKQTSKTSTAMMTLEQAKAARAKAIKGGGQTS